MVVIICSLGFVEHIDHENYNEPEHELESLMHKNQRFTNELEVTGSIDASLAHIQTQWV